MKKQKDRFRCKDSTRNDIQEHLSHKLHEEIKPADPWFTGAGKHVAHVAVESRTVVKKRGSLEDTRLYV